MLAHLDAELKGLSPSYFALVMATGIIAIAAELLDLRPIAVALFVISVCAYVVLWILTGLRVARHRREVVADLISHERGFGFMTIVAGTCVLGSEMVVIADRAGIATALLAIGGVLWLLLTYTIFTAVTIKRDKPTLADGINGGWLLAVVATQSIAVLTALLAAHWQQPMRLDANFVALSMWLWGGMLYIWIIALIFYRYAFFRVSPADLEAPYWINMGAMAISVLAGSLLIINTPDAPYLDSARPFLEGFTIFYWATGTWWIPMLVVLALWRYLWKRFPLRYNTLYWGAVFPFGMYAVATYRMAEAMDLHFLDAVPPVFLGIALATWLVAFVGLIRNLTRKLRVMLPESAETSR
jgi:tellurite resistance protein TehA-like permease